MMQARSNGTSKKFHLEPLERSSDAFDLRLHPMQKSSSSTLEAVLPN